MQIYFLRLYLFQKLLHWSRSSWYLSFINFLTEFDYILLFQKQPYFSLIQFHDCAYMCFTIFANQSLLNFKNSKCPFMFKMRQFSSLLWQLYLFLKALNGFFSYFCFLQLSIKYLWKWNFFNNLLDKKSFLPLIVFSHSSKIDFILVETFFH